MPVNNNRDFLELETHHNSIGGPGTKAMNTTTVQQQQQTPGTPTGDLLGYDEAVVIQQQQSTQHQQSQVINATQATVSITTTGASAPAIAGIGKIEHNTAQNIENTKPKQKTIYIPTYACNGGLDNKFNHYSRYAKPSNLHNLLTSEEYEREIRTLNDKTKKARAKGLDYALLATGALLVPLALWGARHGKQVKRRRKLIDEGVWEFNERMAMEGKNVRMVWNRAKYTGGGESYLTIEEVEESDKEVVGNNRHIGPLGSSAKFDKFD